MVLCIITCVLEIQNFDEAKGNPGRRTDDSELRHTGHVSEADIGQDSSEIIQPFWLWQPLQQHHLWQREPAIKYNPHEISQIKHYCISLLQYLLYCLPMKFCSLILTSYL